jgi:titin
VVAIGNSGNGVTINQGADNNTIGGTAPFEGNVISANGRNGVNINSAGTTGNTVAGNIIGADATGTVDLGNTLSGISIANGAKGTTVGGTTADAANLISGNTKHGIALTGAGTTGNSIIGNLIGTNLAGTTGLGNGRDGVNLTSGAKQNVIGGSAAGEGNTISGNGRAGIVVQVGQTVIQGNRIGTAVDGTTALANSSHGIVVTNKGANTEIGGTNAGEGNVIAFNARAGVLIGRDTTFTVAAANGNSVLGNSIFQNDLLGIIRNGGANRNQAFPTINTATIISAGTQVQVNFQLTSRPNTSFRIELFASPTADPLGFGEGRNFLGFIDVTTAANGTISSTATLNWSAALGNFITATATRLDTNDSSSFSAAVLAT